MKKLFTLLLLAASGYAAQAQVVDVSAAERYFELVDTLKSGKRLHDATWQQFLAMEGNEQYIENQNYKEAYLNNFRKTMEVVYMPEHDSLLQARLQDRQANYMTYSIHVYKAHEAELRQYLAQLAADKEGYVNTMYQTCYSMLPKRLHSKNPETGVYLIALGNDAVAHKGNIVLNLWLEYKFNQVKPGAVGGHELHHTLNKTKRYDVAEQDKSLLLMLQLIMNEGVPDLIDKKYAVAPNMPDDMQWGTYLLDLGKQHLPKVDAAIKEIASGEKQYSSKEIRNQVIGMSGHIPGFYMTDVIERNGLKKKLVSIMGNPFQIIHLYNKAARKDKAKPFVFSDEAIAYLKKVESEAKVLN
ncbi:hypothetical protein K3G39_15875 [Pontibacter sp. HSC-14F20]|uniref:DUF5700 domain-containing putative Zn-dependent protease n=1 Tax=Pontibacter sp. HSC-14F20 TaxID=2864136 RepID=UPI001C735C62|nr:DUF5700 domain-containing putative Zn-dependent protease [Pontibacter sp. HSC-14F20]MBX0334719.1 hypothetical protein [Pontibacter sp. HSC-14F20]